jgi:hypothetical protein
MTRPSPVSTSGLTSTRDPGQRLGAGPGHFLDLDAALHRAHGQEGPVGPVEQERQVVLLRDVDVLGDQHRVHGVALDVHAEDLLRLGLGLVGVAGQLHPAGLAAPAGLDLGLDHDARLAGRDELGGDGTGLRRCPGDLALLDRNAVGSEEILRLVLEQVHSGPSFMLGSAI